MAEAKFTKESEMNEMERDNTQPPPKHTTAHPAVVTGDSARQGPRGRRILYVLVAGLALVALAFVMLSNFTSAVGH